MITNYFDYKYFFPTTESTSIVDENLGFIFLYPNASADRPMITSSIFWFNNLSSANRVYRA
tara:strand:+ start:138 stop:320 length:183 start_codon:yes stop_codon:yes gene_type:complete